MDRSIQLVKIVLVLSGLEPFMACIATILFQFKNSRTIHLIQPLYQAIRSEPYSMTKTEHFGLALPMVWPFMTTGKTSLSERGFRMSPVNCWETMYMIFFKERVKASIF